MLATLAVAIPNLLQHLVAQFKTTDIGCR